MATKEKRKKKKRFSEFTPPDANLPASFNGRNGGDDGLPFPHGTRTNMTSVAAAANRASEREENDSRRRVAFLFLIGAFLLAAVAYELNKAPKSKLNKSEMTSLSNHSRTLQDTIYGKMPKTFDQRVAEHMDKVGAKLNSERIRAQHENLGLARPLPAGEQETPPDPVLHGVPLEGEQPAYMSIVPNDSRLNRSAEAEILFQTQLAKDLAEWEKTARDEYIREFTARANSLGYDVRIDEDYNVSFKPLPILRRSPQNYSTGGVQ